MQVLEEYKIDQYYQAVKERDRRYIGSFFFGVKTTGVFCIPGCRARTPKPQNVVFYTQAEELKAAGFRPCQLCKPLQPAFEAPEEVKKALDMVRQSPQEKITDKRLKAVGIQPEKVRRWFKQHYGITFQAFQRSGRLAEAYQGIRNGKPISHAAFDTGYESLSGFGQSFKNQFSQAPNGQKEQQVVYIKRITTPLGPLWLGTTERGLCMSAFVDQEKLDEMLSIQLGKDGFSMIMADHPMIEQAQKEISNYFNGIRWIFTVKIDIKETIVPKELIESLQNILSGEVCNSHLLAEQVGMSQEQLQVVCENNPLAIILPTHRITNLTLESKGIAERSQYLLNHEKKMLSATE